MFAKPIVFTVLSTLRNPSHYVPQASSICLPSNTYKHTTFLFPSVHPPLLLPFPPSFSSLARHTASLIVGNVNGLSLLGVTAPLSSLAGKFVAATQMGAAHGVYSSL